MDQEIKQSLQDHDGWLIESPDLEILVTNGKLVFNGNPVAIRAVVQALNIAFEVKGVKPLRLPPHLETLLHVGTRTRSIGQNGLRKLWPIWRA